VLSGATGTAATPITLNGGTAADGTGNADNSTRLTADDFFNVHADEDGNLFLSCRDGDGNDPFAACATPTTQPRRRVMFRKDTRGTSWGQGGDPVGGNIAVTITGNTTTQGDTRDNRGDAVGQTAAGKIDRGPKQWKLDGGYGQPPRHLPLWTAMTI